MEFEVYVSTDIYDRGRFREVRLDDPDRSTVTKLYWQRRRSRIVDDEWEFVAIMRENRVGDCNDGPYV